MPLLQIQTSSPAVVPTGWLELLSKDLSRELGKPEAYVMVSLERVPQMLFAGNAAPCAFAALKSIGTFTPDRTEELSAWLCSTLAEGLGVERARIYLEFVDARPHLWGFDGATFA